MKPVVTCLLTQESLKKFIYMNCWSIQLSTTAGQLLEVYLYIYVIFLGSHPAKLLSIGGTEVCCGFAYPRCLQHSITSVLSLLAKYSRLHAQTLVSAKFNFVVNTMYCSDGLQSHIVCGTPFSN